MIFIVTILAILPGLTWLYFALQEDLHPEPKKLIALTFAVGILFAFIAGFAQVVLDSYLSRLNPATFPFNLYNRYSLFAIFAFALIEEISKFGAAYFAIHKNTAFDEPVDAMIYMIAASLGFATIENIGFLYQWANQYSAAAQGLAFLGSLYGIFELSLIRFMGATLLHATTGGIIGYFWAQSIRRFKSRTLIYTGLLFATILHTAFNYLIINSPRQNPVFYSFLLIIIAAFFVLYDFEKLKTKRI